MSIVPTRGYLQKKIKSKIEEMDMTFWGSTEREKGG
jgi:hypothetical protein